MTSWFNLHFSNLFMGLSQHVPITNKQWFICFVQVLFSIIWVTYLALLGVFVKQPDMANPHDFYRGISPPRFSESSQRFHQLDRSEEKWHGLAGISAGVSIACFFVCCCCCCCCCCCGCVCICVCVCVHNVGMNIWDYAWSVLRRTCMRTRAKHIYPTCLRRIYLVLFLFFNLQMQCRPVYKSKQ